MVVLWVAFEGLQRGAAFLGMSRPHGRGYAAVLQNAPVHSGVYPGFYPVLVCRAPLGLSTHHPSARRRLFSPEEELLSLNATPAPWGKGVGD